MNTKIDKLFLGSMSVKVELKDIKNVHLSVYPPNGAIKVSAPFGTNIDTLRVYLSVRIPWIRQQQLKLQSQKRISPREFLTRESHYIWGKRYLMQVIENADFSGVIIDHSTIKLNLKNGQNISQKSKIYQKWQRSELKKEVTRLLKHWEPIIGVKINSLTIRKMKTKWGSCNPDVKTINLNLNLIEKPPEHLEYIVVHELIHLVERSHNANFVAHIDKYIPNWMDIKSQLNQLPLLTI